MSTLCLLIGLFSCGTPEQPTVLTPFVNPPIPELNPKFETFDFLAEEGLHQTLPNGSEIQIPAGALVDQTGAQVTGKVAAKYRELHDGLSIYLSGVPMEYQDKDTSWQFATAGSFELRVQQEDQMLAMADGQEASVKLASYVGGDNYQFYYLDEQGRRWDSLGTQAPVLNEKKKKLRRKIRQKTPGLAFPLNRRYMALNYQIIADVVYGTSNIEAAQDEQLKAKLGAYGLRWKGVHCYQRIDFEGAKEFGVLLVWKNLSGKAFPEWTNKQNSRLEKIRGNTYWLNVASQDSTQHFRCKVRAVMRLKDLFAFSPEEWIKNYQQIMAQIEEERERLRTMAEVYRQFELANFGIYNWDRMLKEEENIPLQADFKFSPGWNEKLLNREVVYISGDNQSVTRYPKKDWERFSLWPQKGGLLFTLLPGKRINLFTRQQYEEIDVESLRQTLEPRYLFEMDSEVHSFNSQEELKQILGI